MCEDVRNASVTRSTPDLPRLRWCQYSLNQRQIRLRSSPWTLSRSFLNPRNTTPSSLSLTMIALRHPSSYPAPKKLQQKGWRNSSSDVYFDTTDSLERSSVTETLDLHQNLPGSCAASWASNRTFLPLITPGRTDSPNGPINGWRPTSGSLSTINRTTGQCTCP